MHGISSSLGSPQISNSASYACTCISSSLEALFRLWLPFEGCALAVSLKSGMACFAAFFLLRKVCFALDASWHCFHLGSPPFSCQPCAGICTWGRATSLTFVAFLCTFADLWSGMACFAFDAFLCHSLGPGPIRLRGLISRSNQSLFAFQDILMIYSSYRRLRPLFRISRE